MEEQVFGGLYSAILIVFPKSILLTTPVLPSQDLPYSLKVLHFIGIFCCLLPSSWHISSYFSTSWYIIRHYIDTWEIMCIESYLWISFLFNEGVLQNNCFKIRKGLSTLQVESHCSRLSSHAYYIPTLVSHLEYLLKGPAVPILPKSHVRVNKEKIWEVKKN